MGRAASWLAEPQDIHRGAEAVISSANGTDYSALPLFLRYKVNTSPEPAVSSAQ